MLVCKVGVGKDSMKKADGEAMERKRKKILQDHAELYRKVFELAPVSITIVDEKGWPIDVNPFHLRDMGQGKTTKEDYMQCAVFDHPSNKLAGLAEKYKKVLAGEVLDEKNVFFPQTSGGYPGFFNVKAVPVFDNDTIIGAVIIHQNTTEKNIYTKKLEEANDALKVLLEQSTNAKHEMEEKILENIKLLVMPYIDELETRLQDTQEQSFLLEISANIETITSSFLKNIRSEYLNLTPREIQVANLIRQGRTNKDIALLLNLSVRTIEYYRMKLRKKFNISNKKISLRSYLLIKS